MYSVHELLDRKGSAVETVSPRVTVREAAERMNARKIGSLVVLADGDEGGRLVGIITERDILTRVVAAGRDAARTLVEDVMTRQVITCTAESHLDDLRAVMRERRIRHVPVLECDRLCGLVSLGDLNLVHAADLTETIRCLEAFIAYG